MNIPELPGLSVTVDRIIYLPRAHAPADRPHQFAYFITIANQSDRPVTVRGRKWVVTDIHGHKIVVEGDGVVGQFPRIEPGQSFSYNSSHLVATDSLAQGAYLVEDDAHHAHYAQIPAFQLRIPDSVK